MEMTGAEVLIKCLAGLGVEHLFMKDHPALISIGNALRSQQRIHWLEPVSEASCVPMADGVTRATGKPAAAVCAGGGHLLSQIVGVASAWADKQPVISIAVCDERPALNSPVFDRAAWKSEEAFAAVSRFSKRVESFESIPEIVRRAMSEANSGRGGPVHLELPRSVLEKSQTISAAELERMARPPLFGQLASPPAGDEKLIQAGFDLIAHAERPLVLAGAGVIKAGAVTEINEFAKKMGIPMASTMAGMGVALPDNPSYIGPSSYLSGEAFHTAIKRADVVLAMGCCFSGLDGFGLPPLWSAKIKFVQVNVDPEDIALNPKAAVAIVGDAGQVLLRMLGLAKTDELAPKRSAWLQLLKQKNQEHQDRVTDEAERPWPTIHPGAVPPRLNRIAGEAEALVVLDGGNTALWAGMLIPAPGPRRGFFPVGMGTLGLGIPVAIGIKAALPDRPVIIVTGDGAFLYNAHELETMRKYGLAITIVVMNDSAWNMIRAGQAMTSPVYGTDLPGQDYAAMARSYGLHSERVTKKEDIEPAFERAFHLGKPALIEVVIDPDSLPDSLVSFGRVEFAGATMPPAKLLGAFKPGRMKLDVRLLNLIKFIWKTR